MTTSEPTTGEIVRALRYCADVNSVCGDACPAHLDEAGCRTVLMQNDADSLESQERENERVKGEMFANALEASERIANLTARAESAERERDELVDLIPHTCNTCYFQSKNLLNEEPCVSCRIYSKWTWRGLPQEGEGNDRIGEKV